MKWETVIAMLQGLAASLLPVPFNVFVGCIAGSYASFSFGDKIEPRSKMYSIWIACIIMGCAFTAVVNASIAFWFEGFKLTSGVQVGIGAIVSCLMRFLLPAIIERIGPWLDKIPFLRKSKPQGE